MQHNIVVDRAVEVLRVRPAGLVVDIDGTISKIAPHPDQAAVEPAARLALERLSGQLDLVAAVSGRGAADAARIVGVGQLVYVGNHGMERCQQGQVVVASDVVPFVSKVSEALDKIRTTIDEPWIFVEDKGATGSIHFRQAPDPETAEETILNSLAPTAERLGLRLTRGRRLIEVRPPVDRNKGTAIRDLVDDFHLRSLIFFGDDVTDLDAMRMIVRLRDGGQFDGLNVGVVGPETPVEVGEMADIVLPDVDAVTQTLTQLAKISH